MSVLDFTAPDRATTDGGFTPVARSAMERRQRDAGARFETRDGWLVPVRLPGEKEYLEHVGIADLSHLGKIEVRGEGAAEPGVIAWHQVRPDRAIVLCETAACADLRARLSERFRLVLDQTGALNVLALVGPQARRVFAHMSHLHELPASGQVAHVGAYVLERDGAIWIVFAQEYGHYLWEVAVDAAEPLGGGPVGVDALAGGSR